MSKIISLTGDLGSGKSTVSAILCQKLNYQYIYTGQIQRKIAERYGMTTMELNIFAETNPEIDKEIDSTFKSLSNSKSLIVDSRLAWFFIPSSFKVFLKTNLMISAKRIADDKQRINENYKSLQEASIKIVERKASEVKRYQQYYGVNCLDMTNYNLIIDTSFIQPQEVADIIVKELDNWTKQPTTKRCYVAPQNLYPTKLKANWQNECGDKIEVVYNNAFDFVVNGHKKVVEAIDNKEKLVEVDYHIQNIDTTDMSQIFEQWQQTNNFKFLVLP